MVELSTEFGGPYMTKGGQGKLFRDLKPEPEHRWPRGYSPERMAAVRAAPIDITVAPKRSPKTTDPFQVRQIQETLARSTTPAGELAKPLRIKAGLKSMSASGTYSSWDREIQLSDAPPKGRQYNQRMRQKNFRRGWDFGREESERTLMHEMGHHRSTLERQSHSRYVTPEEQGQEEAFADANQLERQRRHPQDVRRGEKEFGMPYERDAARSKAPRQGGGAGAGVRFGTAYTEKRKELAEERGIPANVGEENIARKKAGIEAHNAGIAHENMILQGQFFHRDYTEEERSGKPAWQTNPAHIWNDRRD